MDAIFGNNLPPPTATAPPATAVAAAAAAAAGGTGVGAGVSVAAAATGKINELGEMLEARLPSFETSTLLEVQERACICHQLLDLAREADLVGTSDALHAQVHPQPSTLDPQPSTLDPQPSALDPQPSALDPQP
jgi:hypothetical protein